MLLGRVAEAELLSGQIRAGRSVAIHGELGIGKTALLEVIAAADGQGALIGGGLASLAWSSYLPLVRAVRVPLPSGDRAVIAAYVAHRVRDGLLVLDDLQHADRDTLAVLPAIAGRVRLMLALRDGEPGSERALAAAHACSCELLKLEGLAEADALRLVRLRNSTLTELEARAIVASSGGNPMLLQEQARGEVGASSIDAVVQRRMARLSPAARDGVVMLGLLGRAGETDLLGETACELLDAGLVQRQGPLLSLRHAVFGELAIARLEPESRRRLHVALAQRLADPGERARHLAAAGRFGPARVAALEAARTARRLGDRARHLGLAAECADGADADRLRLQAADALGDAGEHALVERVLSRIECKEGPPAAEATLLRARAHLALGAPREAREAAIEGLSLATKSGAIELQLRIERLRAELAAGQPSVSLLTEAAEVCGLCELASVAEGRAALMLGSIELAAEIEEWATPLGRAIELARMAGEFDVECGAAATLVLGHMLHGDGATARGWAQEMEERCAARLLRGPQLQFAAQRLWLDLHERGACSEVIEACRALLVDPVPDPAAVQLHALMALALADAGELREAELVLERALGRPAGDRGRCLAWTLAEVLWLAGEPARAASLARECLADPLVAYPLGALAAVTAAWAGRDAGADAAAPREPARKPQSYGGSDEELAGIGRLVVDDPMAARDTFLRAWESWVGIERRGELRCAWAGADATRRAGDQPEAVATLHRLRAEMLDCGTVALVSRVNRSLREAGVREASGPSADARRLTAREREVLKLVAQGLGTAAIARRLGLAGSTVETHIESARDKLGAANRTQAAIRAFS